MAVPSGAQQIGKDHDDAVFVEALVESPAVAPVGSRGAPEPLLAMPIGSDAKQLGAETGF